VQLTASEGHPWFVEPRPPGDIGGDFTSIKIEVQKGSFDYFRRNGYYNPTPAPSGDVPESKIILARHIEGPVVPAGNVDHPTFNFSWSKSAGGLGVAFSHYPDYSSSDAFLSAQGTIAVDRCSPTNSVSDVSTALGELLREGLPSLPGAQTWKDRLKSPGKDAGSEFLNWQFGIAPLLGEIQDFAKAATQSSKILRQLERDSGRLVRRRYEFPIEQSTHTHTWSGALSPVFSSDEMQSGSSGGSGTTVRTVKKERWFSGAFTYYLPSGGSAFQRVARGYVEFDKLFGGLDAETIWNLTPWSWATDWFFNTGSVISNLSDAASFGLVMPYGYIMERTSVRYDHTLSGQNYWYRQQGKPATISIVHTTKKRRKASPFGFGLSWDGFSGTQLAILAALGITRRA